MKWLISLILVLVSVSIYTQNKEISPQSFLSKDGTLFVNELYKLSWEKGDVGTTYHYQWNDEPWAIFREPIFPPVMGWNEIHFFAEDQLGNRESEQKVNLYVDKIPPKLTTIWKYLPRSWNDVLVAQVSNELRIRAIDDESGVSSLFISLDGGPETKASLLDEWIYLTKEEGKHSVIAYSLDNVKNISKKLEITWLVDSTPPTLSLTGFPQIIKLSDKNVCLRNTKIQISATDKITEAKDLFWRKKNTDVWALTGKIFDIEKYFPYDKKIELEFKAVDFSGNESQSIDFLCEIDRNPPETNILINKQ